MCHDISDKKWWDNETLLFNRPIKFDTTIFLKWKFFSSPTCMQLKSIKIWTIQHQPIHLYQKYLFSCYSLSNRAAGNVHWAEFCFLGLVPAHAPWQLSWSVVLPFEQHRSKCSETTWTLSHTAVVFWLLQSSNYKLVIFWGQITPLTFSHPFFFTVVTFHFTVSWKFKLKLPNSLQ